MHIDDWQISAAHCSGNCDWPSSFHPRPQLDTGYHSVTSGVGQQRGVSPFGAARESREADCNWLLGFHQGTGVMQSAMASLMPMSGQDLSLPTLVDGTTQQHSTPSAMLKHWFSADSMAEHSLQSCQHCCL